MNKQKRVKRQEDLRAYRKANKDRIYRDNQTYYKANREQMLAQQRQYAAAKTVVAPEKMDSQPIKKCCACSSTATAPAMTPP
jgi:hypothetical protein